MLLCAVVSGIAETTEDPQRARALWDELLDALDAVSPLVDDAAPGVVHCDMRGVPGSPQAWIARAHRALDGFGMPVRVALGANKFVARAAAMQGDATVCKRGSEAALVAPLPLRVLEIDPRTLERLRLLGVATLGELARLPHGAFVRRFGPASAVWHDRARGIDPTPFLPRAHALSIEAALFGEGDARAEAELVFALRILLDRVCADLACVGKRAGTLRVEMELENGDVRVRDVGLARPTAQARPMLDVVRANLEGVTFDAPVTGLRVRALQLEEGGETLPLFSGGDPDPQAVAVTLARLEAALGEPARRARDVRAYALEGQFAYDPFALPISALPAIPPRAVSSAASAPVVPQLQLLEVREVAVRVANGAPSFVDSRAVLECAGPWRIEEGWYDTPLVRDEYDVLLDDGALYRIYRQGEHWYLRGTYD